MKIDLSCPVELWHFRMPTREYPVVTLQLFNLTDKAVSSIQAAFLCYNAQGESISRQVERVQGLAGDARSAFEMAVAIEDGADAAWMDFTMERIWFEDGTVWRRGTGNMAEYEDNALPAGRKLDTLRHIAGADAQGYPSDQGAVWVCVCGRPNAASRTDCLRCRREKHAVFTQFNKAAIEKIIFEKESEMEEKARRAREEAGRMQQEREEKELKIRKRRRRIVTTLAVLVLLAGAAYGVYFHGIPAWRYYTASQQLADGSYEEAKEGFLQLADYRDSAQMVLESDYRRAAHAAQTGNLTSLKAAQDLYETLADYKDSATMSLDMRYRRALLLEEAGEYEQAIPLYTQAGSHRDARDKVTFNHYLWAAKLKEDLDYAAAREKFLALGDYRDSDAQAQECLYLPALTAMEKQAYSEALSLLSQLPEGYRDVTLKTQEANYLWGDMLFAAEAYDDAAEKYLTAGDYLDSYLKASSCLYEPALALMAQEEYAAAKEKLDRIKAFRDAARLSEECSCQMGRAALLAGDHAAAIGHFRDAPNVPDAQTLLLEASYLMAEQALVQGDAEGAAALFEQAGSYHDAENRVKDIRYQQGIDAANSGDNDQAIALFTALADYKNSAEELQNAKYNRAIGLLEAGSYREAAEELEALEGYASSHAYLQEARYALAKKDMEAGDYAAAAIAFEALTDYADAFDLYQESVYQQALTALNGEDLAGGTALLAKIPGYQNANELYLQGVYQLAALLKQEGRLGEAAAQFALIGGYKDAAEQREACYDAYFADAYATAKEAMTAKDYKTVVEALHELDRTATGEKYADIQSMYEQANYQYANELYSQDLPYQALPYYKNIPHYRDVSTRKLTRVPYRIIGEWESTKGVVIIFREDGTCSFEGRELYFFAKNYTLKTGTRTDELTENYAIVRLPESGKDLTLQNRRTKTYYKMTRIQ